MTEGERFVGSLPVKLDFHDRSKRRSYDVTRRVAAHLVDNPALVEHGRAYLERCVRPDPAQARYYALWVELLRRDVRQIVRQMLEDTPQGDLLRDTQPVFVVISPEERRPPRDIERR
ncbi:hypothetical protein MKK75_15525 [Methylobacterium sp. J-030]|uniref:hypothetical protein n=1 Tax=Methylobacterium sp. J-030 TaxID=2836627 RepID=UPI001FB9B1D4|nr:hypothetical protein [Methylobacterium sp. J-030]MCJ2070191.1 hypothetical protein [Methylobacterium sp. J-030]